ncbi:MAG: NUDIX domain-containing protein, partial [Pseudomonadota bacterium]
MGAPHHRVRASAVVIRDRHLLAVRHAPDLYWSVPGGAIERGELSQDAALRELMEEIGVAGRVTGLIAVIENQFDYDGARMEEIGFLYAIAADGALPAPPATFPGAEARLTARWLPLSELVYRPSGFLLMLQGRRCSDERDSDRR